MFRPERRNPGFQAGETKRDSLLCGDQPEKIMRALFVFALAASAVAACLCSAPANAYDRRVCLIGGGYPYPGDCAYDTYAQCKMSASGQQAYCDTNPRYAFDEAAGIKRKHSDGFNLSPFIFQGQVR
jgi:hypothetical protein